jgi:hypothetical protein
METTDNAAENAPTSHAPAPDALPPGQLLRQAKRLADQAQELMEQAVVAERAKGTSWETIGEVLDGVTKSAAQKRYGARVNAWVELRNLMEHSAPTLGNPKPLFTRAYNDLWDEWKHAAEIVAAQDVIAELSNATTAASGAGPAPQHLSPFYLNAMLKPLVYHPTLCLACRDQIGPPGQGHFDNPDPHASKERALTEAERWSSAVAQGAAFVQEHLASSGAAPVDQIDQASVARGAAFIEQTFGRPKAPQVEPPHDLSALTKRVARLEKLLETELREERIREGAQEEAEREPRSTPEPPALPRQPGRSEAEEPPAPVKTVSQLRRDTGTY